MLQSLLKFWSLAQLWRTIKNQPQWETGDILLIISTTLTRNDSFCVRHHAGSRHLTCNALSSREKKFVFSPSKFRKIQTLLLIKIFFFFFFFKKIDVKSNPYILIFGRRIDLDTSFYPTTASFLTITTSAAESAGKVLLKTELKCRL